MPVVSKYTQAWNKIKQDKKCVIVAQPAVHARIIKAICKKKDADLAYKQFTLEKGYKSKLKITVEGNTITFTLEKNTVTIEDL